MKFQEKDLVHLRDIIIRDPLALEKWGQIVDHIVEAEVDKAKIKKLLRDAEYAEAVLQAVQKWHLQKTELDLVAIFRRHAMNNLAKEVENFDLSTAASTTQQPTPTLGVLTGIGFQMSDAVPNFVGRESELRKLHTLLLRPQPAFVAGLVGVGKTELARAYAHRNQVLYDGNAMWIRGHSIESMRAGFSALAATLCLPIGRNVTHKIAQSVYDKFHESNSKCLFIFDGVVDLEDFNLFKPMAKQDSNWTPPAVLVTTRRALTQVDNVLSLQVMSKTDAVEFIQNELPRESKRDSLRLADQVECYPLALQQCTAIIRKHRVSIQDCIENCLQTGPGFLSAMSTEKFRSFKTYGLTTLRAAETAITKLQDGSALAKKLLQTLSCLNATAGVSMEFLFQFNKRCILFEELEVTICALEDQSFVSTGGSLAQMYMFHASSAKIRLEGIIQRLMRADPATASVAAIVYKFVLEEMKGNIPEEGEVAEKSELMKECTTHALFHFQLIFEAGRILELEPRFLYHLYWHLIHFDMLDEALLVVSTSYAARKSNDGKTDTPKLLQFGLRYAEVEYQLKHFDEAHRILEELRPHSNGKMRVAIEAAIGRLYCAQGEGNKAGEAIEKVLHMSGDGNPGQLTKV